MICECSTDWGESKVHKSNFEYVLSCLHLSTCAHEYTQQIIGKLGIFMLNIKIFLKYRVRFKEWPPLGKGLVTTFLLRLLWFDLMSCLLWIHLSKEVQYISTDQLELQLLIKMFFQSDPNFYVFEQNSRG